MLHEEFRRFVIKHERISTEQEQRIRARLASDIDAFLSSGGQVAEIPPGESGDESLRIERDQHGRMRYTKTLTPNRKQRVRERKRREGAFTEEQVREIRASNEAGVDLAKRFGVHPNTISKTRTGINYGWVV